MKKLSPFVLFAWLLAACSLPFLAPVISATPMLTPTLTETPTVTLTFTPTVTPTLTPSPSITPGPSPTPTYPPEGFGPTNFPANIDPLTGLTVANQSLLERRPLLVKIANLPRVYRPQWGLSLADQVFEYYIEQGTTRFAALFLGQDASMAGPVRSARLFDNHLMSMYRADFAFGSADYRVLNLLFNQPYSNRLIIESSCPPMCRWEPKSADYLMADTAGLTTLINQRKVPGGNGRQNLDGFAFNAQTPSQGTPVSRVYIRYSSAIYNRWDYNAATGKYERSSDTQDDFQNGANEVYAPLTDRLTGQTVSADNVVVLFVRHQYVKKKPEVVDIVLSGPDDAYLFRDGQLFILKWYRNALDRTLTLAGPDGKTFPLKPGNTWFEVVGTSSAVQVNPADYRFVFKIP